MEAAERPLFAGLVRTWLGVCAAGVLILGLSASVAGPLALVNNGDLTVGQAVAAGIAGFVVVSFVAAVIGFFAVVLGELARLGEKTGHLVLEVGAIRDLEAREAAIRQAELEQTYVERTSSWPAVGQ